MSHFIFVLVLAVLVVIPVWKIVTKAGFSGWWALTVCLPFLNLVFLWIFASANWPAQSTRGDLGG